MEGRIAVFMKDANDTDSSASITKVIVFEKQRTDWNEKDRCYVTLDAGLDLAGVRREYRRLIDRLGDVTVAAGSDISGALYMELSGRGFSVFEIADCSPDTLDGILEDINEARKEAEEAKTPAYPQETETPGVYFLDLVRLQEKNPEITSKMALKAFLESTPFLELRLVCAHVPPWLEAGPYEITAQPGGCEIRVRKEQCRV